MRFTKGAYYRHRNCLDADMYILKVRYAGPKYSILKVNFVSRNREVCFQYNLPVKVLHREHKNWSRI